jgi:hypothetical protein
MSITSLSTSLLIAQPSPLPKKSSIRHKRQPILKLPYRDNEGRDLFAIEQFTLRILCRRGECFLSLNFPGAKDNEVWFKRKNYHYTLDFDNVSYVVGFPTYRDHDASVYDHATKKFIRTSGTKRVRQFVMINKIKDLPDGCVEINPETDMWAKDTYGPMSPSDGWRRA